MIFFEESGVSQRKENRNARKHQKNIPRISRVLTNFIVYKRDTWKGRERLISTMTNMEDNSIHTCFICKEIVEIQKAPLFPLTINIIVIFMQKLPKPGRGIFHEVSRTFIKYNFLSVSVLLSNLGKQYTSQFYKSLVARSFSTKKNSKFFKHLKICYPQESSYCL